MSEKWYEVWFEPNDGCDVPLFGYVKSFNAYTAKEKFSNVVKISINEIVSCEEVSEILIIE